jgi:hypothetical protein
LYNSQIFNIDSPTTDSLWQLATKIINNLGSKNTLIRNTISPPRKIRFIIKLYIYHHPPTQRKGLKEEIESSCRTNYFFCLYCACYLYFDLFLIATNRNENIYIKKLRIQTEYGTCILESCQEHLLLTQIFVNNFPHILKKFSFLSYIIASCFKACTLVSASTS